MPHVPVGVVVEPVIKQASLHGYNNLDFDFFISLSKHPRLTVRHGLMTLDLLGKICLNDPLFGRVGTVPFLILAKRFGDEEVVQEYIERFAKVALSMFMHIETRPDAHPELGRQRNKEAANIIHIRRTLVMEVIAKIAHLRNQDYNARIKPLLLTVGEQHARLQGGKMSRAIVALISMCDATEDNMSSLIGMQEESESDGVESGGDNYMEDDLEVESMRGEDEDFDTGDENELDEDAEEGLYNDDRVEEEQRGNNKKNKNNKNNKNNKRGSRGSRGNSRGSDSGASLDLEDIDSAPSLDQKYDSSSSSTKRAGKNTGQHHESYENRPYGARGH
jgi:hypothetical protein